MLLMTMTPSLVELFMEVRINVLVKVRYNRQISRRMGVKLQNPTHVHELLKVIFFRNKVHSSIRKYEQANCFGPSTSKNKKRKWWGFQRSETDQWFDNAINANIFALIICRLKDKKVANTYYMRIFILNAKNIETEEFSSFKWI